MTTTLELIAQIIGIVACVFIIMSYQQKSNKGLYVWQVVGSIGFCLNYLLLGQASGGMMNFLSIFRQFILYKGEKWKKKWLFVVIELLFVAAVLFSMFVIDADSPTKYYSLIVLAAQLIGTAALWTDDGVKIRRIQLFVVSPLWLVYNILVFTVGGIICEAFNIISIIVSFLRFRKTGFEK